MNPQHVSFYFKLPLSLSIHATGPIMPPPPASVKSFSLITTSLLVVSIVFVVLASSAVALRFYARRMKSLKIEWDDWTILFSLVIDPTPRHPWSNMTTDTQ